MPLKVPFEGPAEDMLMAEIADGQAWSRGERVRPLQRRLDVKPFRLAFTGSRRELMSRACSARAPRYRRAQQYGAKRCCAGSEHEAITIQGQEEVCGSVPSVSNGSGKSIGSLGL